jgi:hypothetical protein
MGEVAGQLAAPTDSELHQRPDLLARDQRPDLLAAPPADELVVLLAQLPAGPEQRALHDRAGHAELLPDLGVGQALELAHHDDLVVILGEPVEGTLKVLDGLLAVDRDIRRRRGRDQDPVLVGSVIARVERRLTGQAFLAIA